MKFSIIIPAYNEEKYLPRLLESIETARSHYSGGRDAVEVIVADNCSTDRTAEVAAHHGARVVLVAKRRIAAARNGGALVATGEILCFIDADSAIHPQPLNSPFSRPMADCFVWPVRHRIVIALIGSRLLPQLIGHLLGGRRGGFQ